MGMDGLGRDAIGSVQLLHARGRRNLGAVEALLAEAKRRRCMLGGPVHLGLVSSHEDALLWRHNVHRHVRQCLCRLVRVCEGARDAVHVWSRLEVRAGAGCRRRHWRLEIWIVAPLGVGSEERSAGHGG